MKSKIYLSKLLEDVDVLLDDLSILIERGIHHLTSPHEDAVLHVTGKNSIKITSDGFSASVRFNEDFKFLSKGHSMNVCDIYSMRMASSYFVFGDEDKAFCMGADFLKVIELLGYLTIDIPSNKNKEESK